MMNNSYLKKFQKVLKLWYSNQNHMVKLSKNMTAPEIIDLRNYMMKIKLYNHTLTKLVKIKEINQWTKLYNRIKLIKINFVLKINLIKLNLCKRTKIDRNGWLKKHKKIPSKIKKTKITMRLTKKKPYKSMNK